MTRKRRDTETLKKEINNLYGNDIIVLGEFINMKTKVKMKCNIHNEYFNKEPDKILNRNQGCPKCGRKRISESRKISNENFKNKFYQHRNANEFKLLSEYKGDKQEINIFHSVCGKIYTTTPSSIWNSNGCPICNDKRKTQLQFKKDMYKLVDNEYELLSCYTNCYTKIKIKHNKCGHEWLVQPNAFLQGSRCPKCRESKGGRSIYEQLDKHHVKYIQQFKIKDCRYIYELPFDFELINEDNVIILIEYDGQQHFEPINHYGGTKRFNRTKLNDQIKNQYCITNNIPLVRIPYWEFNNIEYILENVLIYFNLINNENDTYDKEIVNKYLVNSEWNHDTYISWNDKDKRNVPMKLELLHN